MNSNLILEIHEQAEQYLADRKYEEAICYYQSAIESQPENKYYYFYLGLIFLLQGQEEESQMTWLVAIADENIEQIDHWTAELIDILNKEARRQVQQFNNYQLAWVIRQHIRELNPTDINNLLRLICLSIEIEIYTPETLSKYRIIDLLQNRTYTEDLNQELLILVCDRIFQAATLEPSSLELTKAIATHIKDRQAFIKIILDLGYELAYVSQHNKAIEFCKVGLQIVPKHTQLLNLIVTLYTEIGNYTKAIEYSRFSYSIVETTPEKLIQNLAIIKSLLNAGGLWQELFDLIEKQKQLIDRVVDENPQNLGTSEIAIGLYSTVFYFPYIADHPQENIALRKKIIQLCQSNIESACQGQIERFRNHNKNSSKTKLLDKKKLKIGYISSCFKRHSVGWLARALFKHCDVENFEIYAYMKTSTAVQDPIKDWYIERAKKVHQYSFVTLELADKIYEDGIDILVDLDSLTSNTICGGVLALKPAPIQVTWLGWDASTIPTIDYFIADPYVLPENAQDYYRETIWRLPQTYLAVDGFEISVPTITRADLGIPDDAVVYLGAQRGPKYNPHIAKLQLQILREVPDSYFLIKGFGEQESLNRFFFEMADLQGIARERIKFMPRVESEEIHRANLLIADVVLDTYPYNGATTTMETLWMCIPMVTRVGQQFAARNSYTMMMNAGITEGIARTDEEYIEWGIRLGKDESLRQQVYWKLRNSRQTAPLWNGKQFAREMEKAYEGMWQRYVEDRS